MPPLTPTHPMPIPALPSPPSDLDPMDDKLNMMMMITQLGSYPIPVPRPTDIIPIPSFPLLANNQQLKGGGETLLKELAWRGVPSKKLRKPYTITRPRDRWTSEEHERFLEALLLFGRDWKKIEDFVGTKTTIQIRSHAQKYFLKIQKIGLAAHVPPPHSRRKSGSHQQHPNSSASDVIQSEIPLPLPMGSGFMPTGNSWNPASTSSHVLTYDANAFAEYLCAQGQMRRSNLDEQNANLNWAESLSQACRNEYAAMPSISNPTASFPTSPNLSQVYSFIGNMVDPETTRPIEVFIEKLKQLDPVTLRALLSMIRNLTMQLSSPDFGSLERWFSTYDPDTKAIGKFPHSLA